MFRIATRLNVLLFIFSSLLLMHQDPAHAWSRRGHSLICEVAAYIVADEDKADFLKTHSFDLGYYCNVPDLVWKKPDTYEREWTNHFMNMEVYEREVKADQKAKAFEMDRLAFDAAFPNIKQESGRAYWRVIELDKRLAEIAQTLKEQDLTNEERHKAQGDWLLTAGAIGHYIGDLAQPLHVTEEYDGKSTGQKGIHAFFEETVVDELYMKGLTDEVKRAASKQWPKFRQSIENKPLLAMLQSLAEESNKKLAEILKTDKKNGRENIAKASEKHRKMVVERLAAGALAQAAIYRRHLGWEYNGKRFYIFHGTPEFIAPPAAPKETKPAKK